MFGFYKYYISGKDIALQRKNLHTFYYGGLMTFHIVINPFGASGRALAEWHHIEEILATREIDYRVYFSSRQQPIEDICRRLTSGHDTIKLIVIGGDGTMNEALNGIVNFEKVHLGYIPAGSGNDLAKGLALSSNTEILLDTILRGCVRRSIDVGIVTYRQSQKYLQRRFLVSCGIGFDAEICQRVSAGWWKKWMNKWGLGKFVYLMVATHLIFSSKMVPLTVSYDGESVYYQRCLFVVAMNHSFEGGGFKFCPTAMNDDGRLEMMSVNNIQRLMFFRVFPHAYRGTHLAFKGIESRGGTRIVVRTQTPMWLHTDGEAHGKADNLALETNKKQLKLLM